MVNAPEYRWKRMIGDRDKRPQYKGWWYPQTTNGFGFEDFLIFCKTAGFEPVVSINVEETPQDVADLIDYLNGPVTTEWGRRRAENGHPEPYNLRYLQLGNEETTNAHYIERFKILHDAIRPRDPKVELIIAAWWEPDNPVSRRIVQELDGKAALWDVHVGGDDPREGAKVDALFTRMERLVREWAPGTKLKACVLEENGGRHDIARALGHASVLNATQRHGDFVLIDCPANCLQAWKQNDNGWDQGQLFYTSDKVWGMPPYYAQQMAASVHLPCRVASEVISPGNDLDLTATRDEEGRTLVLKVVNAGNQAHRTDISLDGFVPVQAKAEVTTLSGALDDRNSPEAPERIVPKRSAIDDAGARFSYEFPARSYTILKLTRTAGKG
jgi:alpha-L-arabinofuranosidase